MKAYPTILNIIGLAACMGFILLFGCSGESLTAAPKPWRDVRPTWERGYIHVDLGDEGLLSSWMYERVIQEGMARLLKGRTLPTVIFAHGCSGLARTGSLLGGNRRYVELVAKAGYAVLMPDSFARKSRPLSCDTKKKRGIPGAPHKLINQMRIEEIAYAVRRAREFPWVDQENLFLFGHSQGGNNAARYAGGEFRAHIVSGSVCPWGLRVPEFIPVLSIYSENDPWLRGRNPRGCESQARKWLRPLEFHLFPGNAHNLSRHPRARELILDFLKRHMKRQ